jgi:hypothetical protein
MILARASSGTRNAGGAGAPLAAFGARPVRAISPPESIAPGNDAMIFGSGVLVGVGLSLAALMAFAMF